MREEDTPPGAGAKYRPAADYDLSLKYLGNRNKFLDKPENPHRTRKPIGWRQPQKVPLLARTGDCYFFPPSLQQLAARLYMRVRLGEEWPTVGVTRDFPSIVASKETKEFKMIKIDAPSAFLLGCSNINGGRL